MDTAAFAVRFAPSQCELFAHPAQSQQSAEFDEANDGPFVTAFANQIVYIRSHGWRNWKSLFSAACPVH
eukprot:549203-Hanusia_phi.AAC.3